MKWRQWLRRRAYQDKANLRLFVLGASVFFAGLGLVVLANRWLLPSLLQELLVLLGLVVGTLGGAAALLGYLALALLRVIRMMEKHD
ncbi:hypothetical protein GCM10011297_26310 [Bacterioplanes sanyensis]|uniref:hypothetical protein n=1 Tax=Bacterioplanes sanyensis TaxID=1249553 RepID=UPI0016731C2F|nr:hypothetical protein [Bacterioplanes sanyensis]GGY52159.1 hypothetical protein GCM10011297_26310 [Bacterioplanes sanyensis]